jgi:hypothetical protein
VTGLGKLLGLKLGSNDGMSASWDNGWNGTRETLMGVPMAAATGLG